MEVNSRMAATFVKLDLRTGGSESHNSCPHRSAGDGQGESHRMPHFDIQQKEASCCRRCFAPAGDAVCRVSRKAWGGRAGICRFFCSLRTDPGRKGLIHEHRHLAA
jgi:hypothetical protein